MQCSAPDMTVESKCRYCSDVFSCLRELCEHIAACHVTAIPDTQCDYCDIRFKDALQLAEHEHNHRNPNSIKCNVCGRIFKQLSNLRRHQRLHSDDAIPYQCDLCGKSFSQAGALKVHKRIHSGEKPYKCELCSKTFYHSSTMNRHKRSHFKSKSRLFLFGQASSEVDIKVNQLDNRPIFPSVRTIAKAVQQETKPTNPALSHQLQQQSIQTNSVLSLESVMIPVTVESHHLLNPQVPSTMHQHPQQEISMPTFEITATEALDPSSDGTSLYVLDTKLLIPQTIMDSQEGSAEGDINLAAVSIESTMQSH